MLACPDGFRTEESRRASYIGSISDTHWLCSVQAAIKVLDVQDAIMLKPQDIRVASFREKYDFLKGQIDRQQQEYRNTGKRPAFTLAQSLADTDSDLGKHKMALAKIRREFTRIWNLNGGKTMLDVGIQNSIFTVGEKQRIAVLDYSKCDDFQDSLSKSKTTNLQGSGIFHLNGENIVIIIEK